MPGFGRAERRNVPKRQFTEEFKKKTIKNMIRCKLTTKEAAQKAKVTETAIGYWEDRYYYEAMQELQMKSDNENGVLHKRIIENLFGTR